MNEVDAIHAAVDRMLEPYGKSSPRGATILNQFEAPFDISKPSQHDSKAEFQRELDAVQQSLDHVRGIVRLLAPRDTEAEKLSMLERLRPIINQKLSRQAPRGKIDDPIELVRRNIADVGGFTATIFVFLDMWSALAERHQELKDQENKFWSLAHRAPDYHARAIALRLAKLFAKHTGQRPTVGTSGVSGEPSTSFSRALSDIFEILEIKSGVRPQAEWAVGQLTDEDLWPKLNKLAQIAGSGTVPDVKSRLSELASAVEKKRGDQ